MAQKLFVGGLPFSTSTEHSAQIIEESFDGFPRTIAAAVAKGTERRALMIRVDTAQPVRVPRWASRAAR